MGIEIGQRLPEGRLTVMGENGPEPKTVAEVFGGRTVLLFAVPGAFTPTCHRNHMPGYVEHADAIRAKDVDAVACMSTNGAFVLDHWADATGAKGRIEMLSDGNADFVRAIGLDLDASGLGLGTRAHRFAMLVEDGVVKDLVVEPSPAELGVASAESMLAKL